MGVNKYIYNLCAGMVEGSETIEECVRRELYEETGQHRIGCIGCPMASQRERERHFTRWPKYKALYMNAFDRMLKVRAKKSNPFLANRVSVATVEDVFNWWMGYDVVPGQIDFDTITE